MYQDAEQRAYFEERARYYARAMNRAVERFGAVRDRNNGPDGKLPPNCVLLFDFGDNERDKWEAWCADSLAWCCDCIAGEYDPRASDVERARYVVRGLMQAHDYKGGYGNFWPGPHFQDAKGFVQEWLERVALAPLDVAARAA